LGKERERFCSAMVGSEREGKKASKTQAPLKKGKKKGEGNHRRGKHSALAASEGKIHR